MEKIFNKIKEALVSGLRGAIGTIVRKSGSSPRSEGTKIVIFENGDIFGSIGGGRLEAEIIQKAKGVIERQKPQNIDFYLKGKDVAGLDMICGGDVEIFLEPFNPKDRVLREIIDKILELYGLGKRGGLATCLDQKSWKRGESNKFLITQDREIIGRYEEIPSEQITQLLHITSSKIVNLGNMNYFIEPIVSIPTLFLFGGGHISLHISHIASLVGFRVVVVDDRDEFVNSERFPEASELHCIPFEEVLNRLSINSDSYLVIVTRGHLCDKTVLSQALRTNALYIGMIGSKRKRDTIYRALMDEGYTREDLQRVHCPIGLSIGAETPEEIAISIVAELIKIRAESKEGGVL
ncbi:MAG TPA: XdhC/CoxI family protein [Desulfobacteraceae bacterium]|nr:XdhC/CoxI family protein [Desulfobacteraceae bacterium]